MDAHAPEHRQQCGVRRGFAAHTAEDAVVLRRPRRHGDETEYRRLIRRVQVFHRRIAALDGQRVLDQIVRTNREEIHFLSQAVRQQRGRRDLDHDTDLDRRNMLTLGQQLFPRLREHGLGLPQLLE